MNQFSDRAWCLEVYLEPLTVQEKEAGVLQAKPNCWFRLYKGLTLEDAIEKGKDMLFHYRGNSPHADQIRLTNTSTKEVISWAAL